MCINPNKKSFVKEYTSSRKFMKTVGYNTIYTTLRDRPKLCVLRQKGCSSNYGGQEVTVEPKYPFMINMVVNIPAGYKVSLCYICSGSDYVVTYDDLEIT